MKIKLKDTRLAFSQNLFEPGTVNGEGKPAYSSTFIFAPSSPARKALDEAIEAVGKEKWGTKWPAVKKELVAKDRLAIHDGDAKASYDGFPGNFYVGARNEARPKVRDADGVTDLNKADGKPYSGCYVNVVLDVWAMDNQFGKRVNARLLGVQFVRDGDAFAGGAAADDDDFDDLGVDDDDDDLTT